LLDRLALSLLPAIPTPVMRRLAGRYIAGERLEDALARLAELAGRGFPGILDLLGENVTSESGARAVVASYAEASAALARVQLDAYVSVKPTHVGLALSEELAFELYAELARTTRAHGQRLRVEMEDHPTTDATLRVFERLRERFDHVGIVLQSRLLRTPADIARLAPGPLDVRLVKGIYLEPAAIAHTEYAPIRRAYVECALALLQRDASLSFATHDEHLAEELFALVRERGVPRGRYELQVLLGVREALWDRWRDAGHRVRVYVPYGPEWRPYSTRRLRKNPQIFRHVVRDTLSLGRR
ncbi:MAG TPA: proline dehydrogenase family protein, partial [Planctomycetota bacterium]|nr:proline dehydrogenase family protein [Planctomycetota bacterium]